MSLLTIGSEVDLPQGQTGLLKWTGRIPDRGNIEYAGVEVLGPEATRLGRHSGEYRGRKFFSTSVPGTGLFLSYSQLISANIKSPRSFRPRSPVRSPPKQIRTSMPSPQLNAMPSSANESIDDMVHAEELRAAHEKIEYLQNTLTQRRNEFRQELGHVNAVSQNVCDAYEQRIKELSAGATHELDDRFSALAQMQNNLLQESAQQKEELARMRGENLNLQQELMRARRVSSSDDEVAALLAEIEAQESRIAKLRHFEEDANQLREKLQQQEIDNKPLTDQMESLKVDSPSLSSEVTSLTQERDELLSKLQSFKTKAEECASLKLEREQLEKALEEKVLREQELEEQVQSLKLEVLKKSQQGPESPPSSAPLNSVTANNDVAGGRDDWCALCERTGHTAVECPYED